MSDERVVVEQKKCEHGLSAEHLLYPPNVAISCTGPGRRTLTPGEYVLVERTTSGLNWPDDTLDVIAQITGDAWLHRAARILDALLEVRNE